MKTFEKQKELRNKEAQRIEVNQDKFYYGLLVFVIAMYILLVSFALSN